MDGTVGAAALLGGEVPGIDRVWADAEPRLGVPPLGVARLVIDALLEPRQHGGEPVVVTGHPVIMHRAFDDKVFDVRLEFQAYQREIVLRVEDAAVTRHELPVHIVDLLYEFVVLSVRALGVDNELEESKRIALPVHPALHLLHMIANPVVVADNYLAVDEKQSTVYGDCFAKPLQKHAEPRILRGEESGCGPFRIVVDPARGISVFHPR